MQSRSFWDWMMFEEFGTDSLRVCARMLQLCKRLTVCINFTACSHPPFVTIGCRSQDKRKRLVSRRTKRTPLLGFFFEARLRLQKRRESV